MSLPHSNIYCPVIFYVSRKVRSERVRCPRNNFVQGSLSENGEAWRRFCHGIFLRFQNSISANASGSPDFRDILLSQVIATTKLVSQREKRYLHGLSRSVTLIAGFINLPSIGWSDFPSLSIHRFRNEFHFYCCRFRSPLFVSEILVKKAIFPVVGSGMLSLEIYRRML